MATLFGYSLSLVLLVTGVALCIAEALAPGAHLIVLGVALLFAGLVGLTLGGPDGAIPFLAEPLVLAALVLGFGALALYVYREVEFYGGSGSGRTSDSDSLTGREGEVIERVTRSSGRVRLHDGGFDPVYSARAVDGEIPEGTQVMVVNPGGGSVLTVESIEGVTDDIDRELARGRESGNEETETGTETETETETGTETETEAETETETEAETETGTETETETATSSDREESSADAERETEQ